jgi:hypothetical protein
MASESKSASAVPGVPLFGAVAARALSEASTCSECITRLLGLEYRAYASQYTKSADESWVPFLDDDDAVVVVAVGVF